MLNVFIVENGEKPQHVLSIPENDMQLALDLTYAWINFSNRLDDDIQFMIDNDRSDYESL